MIPTKMAESKVQNALRVSQLDAGELDLQLFDLLRGRIDSIFKYFKPQLLTKFTPEVGAILRLVLWKYSIHSDNSTIGQQLLELKYKNVKSTQLNNEIWMSTPQKWFYAVLTVGGPWLEERLDDISTRVRQLRNWEHLIKFLDRTVIAWKIAALINFLIFLTRGRYQYLLERVLGIRAVFPRPQGIRQIGFEYMDRELLWHGFAEFLFFVIPLINFNKVKNFVLRLIYPPSVKNTKASRISKDFEECGICNQWPYNPHEVGCRHIFCYYCIKSNYLADTSYACPMCGKRIDNPENIKAVTVVEDLDAIE